ncbi:hypothetical protein CHLNCDRAFT_48751 [Chlorella variabilis]|uniref:Aldehyde dehydrogenase domain-containing protein n=1 Tax=Chlorella variabilis TaxID=554065 RepID=E1ZDJ4_CHLVA|nr:hypothetical protein CHLNCDRAFT_48751 [Chlorella variabilis]EFN56424.1 hypothetical protein CHLNCDRAFT_48751 [Chlorella variabilis]|eukprot:XP_005848526.1 hypothetical protein CHLNCDRAFT_48751 [Chlorella variabilis]
METVKLLIDGQFLDSKTKEWVDVRNPATQEVVARLPLCTGEEFNAAVQSSKDAFPKWRTTPVPLRARVMLRLQELINRHMDELAASVTREQGKTLADARGDVFRGLGEHGVACGVVCAWCAMIPLWMFPMATAAGNCMVLKPSERDPGAAMMLAELALEAGLPKGVLNVVHGTHDTVNRTLDHPDIAAISFVGSDAAGKYIYERGCANGKRVQANMGAKNHAVVMPDANPEATVAALTGAAFGAAGPALHGHLGGGVCGGHGALNAGWEAGADLGPVISPEAKQRIERLIASGIQQGAVCDLDGRGASVAGYPDGNWVGPTILSGVTTGHGVLPGRRSSAPCWSAWRWGRDADSLEEAISIINANEHGNGTALFTASGAAARRFQQDVDVGMVGINIPIPVPLPYFSFTGWRGSFYGDLQMYGRMGVQFYTRVKTVTQSWKDSDAPGVIPGLAGVGASTPGKH